ncbi:MAG: hypothetical protein ACRD2N_10295 [Vicinamibacterales bacterium]
MINDLFDAIESGKTAAELNVLSGAGPFLRALQSLPGVRSLAASSRSNPAVALQVLRRLEQLSKKQIDRRFENPNDVAIAAYILILSSADRDIKRAALAASATAENCWWATRVAEGVRQEDGVTGSGAATDRDSHA